MKSQFVKARAFTVSLCVKLRACVPSLQSCLTRRPYRLQPTRLLSMGFSRPEHWSGLPCSPPGHLSYPGIEPTSPVTPVWQADSLPLSHWGSPRPEPSTSRQVPESKSRRKTGCPHGSKEQTLRLRALSYPSSILCYFALNSVYFSMFQFFHL